jgi:hypothetical protein
VKPANDHIKIDALVLDRRPKAVRIIGTLGERSRKFWMPLAAVSVFSHIRLRVESDEAMELDVARWKLREAGLLDAGALPEESYRFKVLRGVADSYRKELASRYAPGRMKGPLEIGFILKQADEYFVAMAEDARLAEREACIRAVRGIPGAEAAIRAKVAA